MKNNLKGVIILWITAIIWGSAFVAQSMGSNYVDPFTFNGLRFTIAGIVLLIASFFIKQINIKKNPDYKLINYGSKDNGRRPNYNSYIDGNTVESIIHIVNRMKIKNGYKRYIEIEIEKKLEKKGQSNQEKKD